MERYEYLETISSGAYGVCYKVLDTVTGQHCAAKGIKSAHEDVEVMRLTLREVRILKALPPHVNIVRLLEAFRSQSGRVYLVFEYVDRSLFQEMDRHPSCSLPAPMVKSVAWQLLHALGHCHAHKIMHRDVKPANILLTGYTPGVGSGGVVKLCDFGFARYIPGAVGPDGKALTNGNETGNGNGNGNGKANRLSSYVMTRWYRPPEVLVGDVYGTPIDVWSYGCTLAELATGRPLFPGRSTVDQLWRIIRCLGPLPPSQAACVRRDSRLEPLWGVTARVKTSLRQRLPYLDARLFDLVSACLTLDPTRRPTVHQLLQMPYFWDVRRLIAGTDLERQLPYATDMLCTITPTTTAQASAALAAASAERKQPPAAANGAAAAELVTVAVKALAAAAAASSADADTEGAAAEAAGRHAATAPVASPAPAAHACAPPPMATDEKPVQLEAQGPARPELLRVPGADHLRDTVTPEPVAPLRATAAVPAPPPSGGPTAAGSVSLALAAGLAADAAGPASADGESHSAAQHAAVVQRAAEPALSLSWAPGLSRPAPPPLPPPSPVAQGAGAAADAGPDPVAAPTLSPGTGQVAGPEEGAEEGEQQQWRSDVLGRDVPAVAAAAADATEQRVAPAAVETAAAAAVAVPLDVATASAVRLALHTSAASGASAARAPAPDMASTRAATAAAAGQTITVGQSNSGFAAAAALAAAAAAAPIQLPCEPPGSSLLSYAAASPSQLLYGATTPSPLPYVLNPLSYGAGAIGGYGTIAAAACGGSGLDGMLCAAVAAVAAVGAAVSSVTTVNGGAAAAAGGGGAAAAAADGSDATLPNLPGAVNTSAPAINPANTPAKACVDPPASPYSPAGTSFGLLYGSHAAVPSPALPPALRPPSQPAWPRAAIPAACTGAAAGSSLGGGGGAGGRLTLRMSFDSHYGAAGTYYASDGGAPGGATLGGASEAAPAAAAEGTFYGLDTDPDLSCFGSPAGAPGLSTFLARGARLPHMRGPPLPPGVRLMSSTGTITAPGSPAVSIIDGGVHGDLLLLPGGPASHTLPYDQYDFSATVPPSPHGGTSFSSHHVLSTPAAKPSVFTSDRAWRWAPGQPQGQPVAMAAELRGSSGGGGYGGGGGLGGRSHAHGSSGAFAHPLRWLGAHLPGGANRADGGGDGAVAGAHAGVPAEYGSNRSTGGAGPRGGGAGGAPASSTFAHTMRWLGVHAAGGVGADAAPHGPLATTCIDEVVRSRLRVSGSCGGSLVLGHTGSTAADVCSYVPYVSAPYNTAIGAGVSGCGERPLVPSCSANLPPTAAGAGQSPHGAMLHGIAAAASPAGPAASSAAGSSAHDSSGAFAGGPGGGAAAAAAAAASSGSSPVAARPVGLPLVPSWRKLLHRKATHDESPLHLQQQQQLSHLPLPPPPAQPPGRLSMRQSQLQRMLTAAERQHAAGSGGGSGGGNSLGGSQAAATAAALAASCLPPVEAAAPLQPPPAAASPPPALARSSYTMPPTRRIHSTGGHGNAQPASWSLGPTAAAPPPPARAVVVAAAVVNMQSYGSRAINAVAAQAGSTASMSDAYGDSEVASVFTAAAAAAAGVEALERGGGSDGARATSELQLQQSLQTLSSVAEAAAAADADGTQRASPAPAPPPQQVLPGDAAALAAASGEQLALSMVRRATAPAPLAAAGMAQPLRASRQTSCRRNSGSGNTSRFASRSALSPYQKVSTGAGSSGAHAQEHDGHPSTDPGCFSSAGAVFKGIFASLRMRPPSSRRPSRGAADKSHSSTVGDSEYGTQRSARGGRRSSSQYDSGGGGARAFADSSANRTTNASGGSMEAVATTAAAAAAGPNSQDTGGFSCTSHGLQTVSPGLYGSRQGSLPYAKVSTGSGLLGASSSSGEGIAAAAAAALAAAGLDSAAAASAGGGAAQGFSGYSTYYSAYSNYLAPQGAAPTIPEAEAEESSVVLQAAADWAVGGTPATPSCAAAAAGGGGGWSINVAAGRAASNAAAAAQANVPPADAAAKSLDGAASAASAAAASAATGGGSGGGLKRRLRSMRQRLRVMLMSLRP